MPHLTYWRSLLYRNGILHGNILQFDNLEIAARAWNLLFSVADLAKSLDRTDIESVAKDWQSKEIIDPAQLIREREAINQWRTSTIHSNDEEFTLAPVMIRSRTFMESWLNENYKQMSELVIQDVLVNKLSARPAQMRELFKDYPLTQYRIEKLEFVAPVVCEAHLTLMIDKTSQAGRLRWVRHKSGSDAPDVLNTDGEWMLTNAGPTTILER